MVWYNPYTWFPKTTASILSSLHNLVAELEGHNETQNAKATYHCDKAKEHHGLELAAAAEATNAAIVAAKVKQLINPLPTFTQDDLGQFRKVRVEPGDVGAATPR